MVLCCESSCTRRALANPSFFLFRHWICACVLPSRLRPSSDLPPAPRRLQVTRLYQRSWVQQVMLRTDATCEGRHPAAAAGSRWSANLKVVMIQQPQSRLRNRELTQTEKVTPLHFTSLRRKLPVSRVLPDPGTIINAESKNHQTLLHRVLLKHGVDSDALRMMHEGSSKHCIGHRKADLWELLGSLSSGIDVNTQDANHATSFHLASSTSLLQYHESGTKYITSPTTLLSLTSPPAPHYQPSYLSPSLCEPNLLSSESHIHRECGARAIYLIGLVNHVRALRVQIPGRR